jgi:hypothetical protein
MTCGAIVAIVILTQTVTTAIGWIIVEAYRQRRRRGLQPSEQIDRIHRVIHGRFR